MKSATPLAYYVHGLGLISRITPTNEARYYHSDPIGSSVALTDTAQVVTDSYAYDPFGTLANSSGTTSNPFKYVGRYGVMDEGNSLSYIRARYYESSLGRFVSKDPLTGRDSDGQSLNRYVYALNSPAVLIDISGLSAQEGASQFSLRGSSDVNHTFLMDGFGFNTAGTTPTLLPGTTGAGYPWWYRLTGFADRIDPNFTFEISGSALDATYEPVVKVQAPTGTYLRGLPGSNQSIGRIARAGSDIVGAVDITVEAIQQARESFSDPQLSFGQALGRTSLTAAATGLSSIAGGLVFIGVVATLPVTIPTAAVAVTAVATGAVVSYTANRVYDRYKGNVFRAFDWAADKGGSALFWASTKLGY